MQLLDIAALVRVNRLLVWCLFVLNSKIRELVQVLAAFAESLLQSRPQLFSRRRSRRSFQVIQMSTNQVLVFGPLESGILDSSLFPVSA